MAEAPAVDFRPDPTPRQRQRGPPPCLAEMKVRILSDSFLVQLLVSLLFFVGTVAMLFVLIFNSVFYISFN